MFPLVMALYCIDRLNDNKSAIFTEWWKQFVANVFTNSIHAMVYGVIFSVIINGDKYSNTVQLIALFFLMPATNMARQIFGVAKGGMADLVGAGAVMGAASIMGKMKLGGSSSGSKAKSGGDAGGSPGDSAGAGGGSNGVSSNRIFSKANAMNATSKTAKFLAGAAGAATAAVGVAATGGGIGDSVGAGIVGKGVSQLPFTAGKKVVGAGKRSSEAFKDWEARRKLKNKEVEAKTYANRMEFKTKDRKTGKEETFSRYGDYSDQVNSLTNPLLHKFTTDQDGEIDGNKLNVSGKSIDDLVQSDLSFENEAIESRNNLLNTQFAADLGVDFSQYNLNSKTDSTALERAIESAYGSTGTLADPDKKKQAMDAVDGLRSLHRQRQTSETKLRAQYGDRSKNISGLIKQNFAPRDSRSKFDRKRSPNPITSISDI